MFKPLADRIRPQKIEDMVGQKHLLSEGKVLYNILLSEKLPNLIFYGPSGVGKTTLATIIAKQTDRHIVKLNGTTASTADIKEAVSKLNTMLAPNGILLYLDEIQYFTKKQQQTLLEYIETGEITLIASTTENPYFYIYNAVLSRSVVFEFKPVEPEEIEKAVERAFEFLENEQGRKILREKNVAKIISVSCGGDVRKAINATELCVLAAGDDIVKEEVAAVLGQTSSVKYDKNGDEHYDILSAFQKSMRGSDANAALHYLARLLEAGDLASATRRLAVCACEDVGLAYPQIIPIVKSAIDIAFQVGMPEARIPLADAVVLVCNSPKSNSAYLAFDSAYEDLKKQGSLPIPRSLQNKHFDGEDNQNKGQFYNYPHNYENHWIKQQYLPDLIKDRVYYNFGDNKNEKAAEAYWNKIKGELK